MKKRISLQDKAVLAMKSAIREVIERHKKSGRPLAIWKNGRTVRLSPDKL
jgi:20S proteasome alpha/beta subunit